MRASVLGCYEWRTLRAPAILTGRHEFCRGERGSARVSRNVVAKGYAMEFESRIQLLVCFTSVRLGSRTITQLCLSPKRELTPALRWHRKIPRTRNG
jgi:hypothetical protein